MENERGNNMSFIENIKSRAKDAQKTIVLPETNNPRNNNINYPVVISIVDDVQMENPDESSAQEHLQPEYVTHPPYRPDRHDACH